MFGICTCMSLYLGQCMCHPRAVGWDVSCGLGASSALASLEGACGLSCCLVLAGGLGAEVVAWLGSLWMSCFTSCLGGAGCDLSMGVVLLPWAVAHGTGLEWNGLQACLPCLHTWYSLRAVEATSMSRVLIVAWSLFLLVCLKWWLRVGSC